MAFAIVLEIHDELEIYSSLYTARVEKRRIYDIHVIHMKVKYGCRFCNKNDTNTNVEF